MSRRLKQAALAIVVVFAAAQLIRPNRTNPPTEASRTIATHLGTASGAPAVLDRSCGDCHSNATVWPWYTQVAPVSWAMVYAVRVGRNAVNFSEWAAYPPDRQRALLAASCREATEGRMPGGAWTLIRPSARLSSQDVEAICAAGRL